MADRKKTQGDPNTGGDEKNMPRGGRPHERGVPRGDNASSEEVERAQEGKTTGTERKTRGTSEPKSPDRSTIQRESDEE